MFPTTRVVTQRACSRSLKGVHPMPRRAFRNDVSRCRHFGGVIQYSWTRAAPSAVRSRCPCPATPARSGGRRSVHGLLAPPGPQNDADGQQARQGNAARHGDVYAGFGRHAARPCSSPQYTQNLSVGLRSFQPNFLTGFCHQKLRAGELTGPCHLLEPPIPVGVAKPLSMMLVY